MSKLVDEFEDTTPIDAGFYEGDKVLALLAHARALETLLAKFHAGVLYCPACHRHMNPASHTDDCECTALLHAE